MRWTENDLAELQSRRGKATARASPAVKPQDRMLALGRLKTGEMNKTEASYDAHLWLRRTAGEILWHKFEGIKLRLADNTFYTPDFAVMLKDCSFEMREVKGFMMDDANVKIKVAADMYPFRFLVVRARSKKLGGGWDERIV